jgi:hypothetical protein
MQRRKCFVSFSRIRTRSQARSKARRSAKEAGSKEADVAPEVGLTDRSGVARSHLDRHLAVLAEVRLLTGQPRFNEFKGTNDRARRSIPQFRRQKLDL